MTRARLPFVPVIALALALIILLIVPVGVIIVNALRPDTLASLLSETTLAALHLSLVTTSITLALTLLFGTPLAYLLARYSFWGKRVLDTLIDLPIVLPPTVAGLGLLLTFGRQGVLGSYLDAAGIRVAYTPLAVILAQMFVASPLYVRTLRTGFVKGVVGLESAALTLGAGRWRTFWRVTLPLATPQLLEGMVLTWARALGEFGATLLFAGSLSGRTQTMPLAIYAAFEFDLNAALGLSAILTLVAFALLSIFRLLTRFDSDI